MVLKSCGSVLAAQISYFYLGSKCSSALKWDSQKQNLAFPSIFVFLNLWTVLEIMPTQFKWNWQKYCLFQMSDLIYINNIYFLNISIGAGYLALVLKPWSMFCEMSFRLQLWHLIIPHGNISVFLLHIFIISFPCSPQCKTY